MASPNYELIKEAIVAGHQVIANYRGRRREMCPHTLGHTNGREQGLFFQFGGESSKGLPDGGEWRCMDIALIESLEVVEGEWHTRDDHSRPQTCVEVVDVEVAH